MKIPICLFLALFFGQAAVAADASPRYFSAAPGALAEAKARLAAGDTTLGSALERLVADADEALKVKPPTVMDKLKPGASGDKHDYASQAPYLWPDPAKPDGLPYIPRDGVVNPESRTDASDQMRLEEFGRTVSALTLAYYFTGNEAYAEHAARCLRVWFLDVATKMNPNFKQGQAVPGKNTGRNIGIIEIGGLVDSIDGSSLLAGSPAWTAADAAALKQWTEAFLDWLVNSEMGREEAAMQQNHGTMYDVRAVLLALHVGNRELARQICETAKTRRIALQIEPDGRQPLELRRTKSFNYSRLNLNGLTTLATIARWVDVDLWCFATPDGRSIRRALDYMVPFVKTPPQPWSDKQIVPIKREEMAGAFRAAAIGYNEPTYEDLVTGLPDTAKARFQLLRPKPVFTSTKSAIGSASDSGFETLFNGRDWTGWTMKVREGGDAVARRVFGIEDGMIHVYKDLPDRHELDTGKNDTHGMIYTTKRYKNYIFRFDYKWGRKIANNFTQFQYDAGCFYHVIDDKIWPKGLEYQVRYNHLENHNHTGDFWAPPDTRIRWSSGDGKTWLAPTAGGTLQPQRRGEHRGAPGAPFHGLDGGWNHCEVIVMGGRYAIHKLNGVVVNYAEDLSPDEGLIGLQAETAEILYRNIEIKEFTEPVPAANFLP